MRVGLIASYPPPPTGVGTYTKNLTSALEQAGVSVAILANLGHQTNGNPHILRVWEEANPLYPIQIFRAILSTPCNLIHIQHEYWLFGRGLWSLGFPLLCLLLRALKKPLVITIHGIVPRSALNGAFFERHGLTSRFVRAKRSYILFYNKIMGTSASALIVHSKSSKEILIAEYGISPQKVTVIPHGTRAMESSKEPAQAKKALGFCSRTLVLVFGQIRKGKGIEVAIDAIASLRHRRVHCVLLIAGLYDPVLSPESAGYLEELKRQVSRQGLMDCVVFRTSVPEDEIEVLLSAADIVLLPYTEADIIAASGPALLALGYGKAIVATSLPRFKEYLIDKTNAILVPPHSPSAIASSVEKLLKDSFLHDSLAKSARQTAHRLEWTVVAKQTANLYRKLIQA